MNPLDFLRDNIFYNDAKTKQINNAMRKNSGQSSNPIRPSQPNGEPTAYAQHAGTAYYDTSDGRSVYQTNGVVYDAKSGAQVFDHNKTGETMTYDGPFSKTPGSSDPYVGTNGVNIDGQVIHKGMQVWKVPDSTKSDNGDASNSGRGDKRTNAAGVAQTGTNMNRSFNDLLATTNTSGYVPFGSNQLPTTAGSPDSAVTPKTKAILAGSNPDTNIGPVADGQEYANNLGRQGTKGIGPVADGQVYGNMLQNSPNAGTKGIGPLADGDAYAQSLGKGDIKSSRLADALSDKEGINSYMSKFSSGDQERLANRAFLDTKDSMLALRAKEAVNGVVYAGGQHYVAGESADSPAIAIKRGSARDIASGKQTASGLRDVYIDALKKSKASSTPVERQEPATIEKPGVKESFARTEPITKGIDTTIPDTTAFNTNNDDAIPGFGNTGGYKPMSKKPGVDYSSIFSY